MEIREQIIINAPLKDVWHLFSRLEEWGGWNNVCRNCCITSGDNILSSGTCFSFIIRPLVFPVSIKPKIVSCDPGRLVIWEGHKMGISASHTWQFSEANGYVKLLSVERFAGPMVWLGYVLGMRKRLHRLTRIFMLSLKNRAEECQS